MERVRAYFRDLDEFARLFRRWHQLRTILPRVEHPTHHRDSHFTHSILSRLKLGRVDESTFAFLPDPFALLD